jgi:hypothetical protein
MNDFDATALGLIPCAGDRMEWDTKILPRLSISATRLDLDDKHEPVPMDTLGSLVDKLCTVSLKMWHNQEVLYAIRRMPHDEFVKVYAEDLDGLRKLIARACDLNVQRSRLMDAIDKHFASVTSGETMAVVAEQHKTY